MRKDTYKQEQRTKAWRLANPERSRAWALANKQRIAATRKARQAVGQAYIQAIRDRTYCESCGAQPIEWHRPEHTAHRHWRLGHPSMAQSSFERINAEIAACQALCRRCHMIEAGRLPALVEAGVKYPNQRKHNTP